MKASDFVGRLIGWGRELLHDLAILGSTHCIHAERDWHDYNRAVLRRRAAQGGATPRMHARPKVIGR